MGGETKIRDKDSNRTSREKCSITRKGTGPLKPQVRYGVRSSKFIWALCTQLYSLAETPHPFATLYLQICSSDQLLHTSTSIAYTERKKTKIKKENVLNRNSLGSASKITSTERF